MTRISKVKRHKTLIKDALESVNILENFLTSEVLQVFFPSPYENIRFNLLSWILQSILIYTSGTRVVRRYNLGWSSLACTLLSTKTLHVNTKEQNWCFWRWGVGTGMRVHQEVNVTESSNTSSKTLIQKHWQETIVSEAIFYKCPFISLPPLVTKGKYT